MQTTSLVNETAVKTVVRKPLTSRHAPTKVASQQNGINKAAYKKAAFPKPASTNHFHKKQVLCLPPRLAGTVF
jgi:hypothetical protein